MLGITHLNNSKTSSFMPFTMYCAMYSARKLHWFNGFVVSSSALKNKKTLLLNPVCGKHCRESFNLQKFLIQFPGEKKKQKHISFSNWIIRHTGAAEKEIQGSVQKEIKVKPPFPAVLPQFTLCFLLVSTLLQGKVYSEALLTAILLVHFYLKLSKRRNISRRQDCMAEIRT